jgi:heme iron utilization protein
VPARICRVSEGASNRDAAALGRRLMRRCERGALATSLGGAPYASLVLVGLDLDATPLLLISDLAQHSRNIAFDPRIALLFDGTEDAADRLDGPRLTVLGQAIIVTDARLLARFTARHPSSARYAGFADFRLYRITVERAHFVAGFGRIQWIDGAELCLTADVAALARAEPAILLHMNADHDTAINLYAQRLLGRAQTGWRMTGIDPEGVDLRGGGETARLDFPAPVVSAEEARAALVRLAEKARF